MKSIKRLLAILLSLVMVLGMAVTVAAAGYTITINNAKEGHTYEAYQIFSGGMAKGMLTDIAWGAGVSEEGKAALGDAASKAEALKTEADAVAFAKEVSQYLINPSGTANTVKEGKYVISDLSAGYYLIKDADDTLTGDHDAYTGYILKIVSDVEVSPKSALPTVDKQVLDETADAETGHTKGWGETADHAINESFQFKLTATLPVNHNFAAYEKYKVVFTDKMSDGVTFESIASVTVDGQVVSLKDAANPNGYAYTATAGQAGGSWTLTIADIKSITGVVLTDGAKIEIIYNAHLNEKATVNHESGETDNKNTVDLQYSNNPYAADELGKTPEDSVWVFTYRVDNTKVDGSNNNAALAGAGFRLYDVAGAEISLIYDAVLGAYRPTKNGETGEEMFSAVTTGKFDIVGLDAGTYTLKETTTPADYNKCNDVTIVIGATHVEDGTGAGASTTLDTGSTMSNTIVNNKGAQLPETGGIGTTVFYVVGGILVFAAVVLLVTKKRMKSVEK